MTDDLGLMRRGREREFELFFFGPVYSLCPRYQLATKISDRLEEMGQDLGSMIEEINDTSSDLTKRARPDDPVRIPSSCIIRTDMLIFK